MNGERSSLEVAGGAERTGADPRSNGLASLDLAAFDEDRQSLPIWPCRHCRRWHAEAVETVDGLVIREWHAADCQHFIALMTEE